MRLSLFPFISGFLLAFISTLSFSVLAQEVSEPLIIDQPVIEQPIYSKAIMDRIASTSLDVATVAQQIHTEQIVDEVSYKLDTIISLLRLIYEK